MSRKTMLPDGDGHFTPIPIPDAFLSSPRLFKIRIVAAKDSRWDDSVGRNSAAAAAAVIAAAATTAFSFEAAVHKESDDVWVVIGSQPPDHTASPALAQAAFFALAKITLVRALQSSPVWRGTDFSNFAARGNNPPG